MNVYDIFGSGRRAAVTESKIEVVHEYVNEDFGGLMFGANNEDIAGPGGSDNNDSTSPIHGFGEDYNDIPDLENVGEQVVSIMDAERRLAQGDRIFAFHEMDEEPSEIHDVGQLAGYDAEQLLAVPQGVAGGSLNEFAVSGDSGGDDDSLFNYAKMWYNGDLKTQRQVEKALQKAGLDIGENEDENGGAYISDMSGDYYESWTAEDLEQGVAEGRVLHRDLKSWTDDAKSQGLNVIKPKNDLEWTHHATDKTGKVCGKFCTTNVPQNSRGFIHKQGLAEMDGDGTRDCEVAGPNIHLGPDSQVTGKQFTKTAQDLLNKTYADQTSAMAQKAIVQKKVHEARGDYKPPKEADYGDDYQDMVKRVAAQEKRKQQQQPQKKVSEDDQIASPASRELVRVARQSNPEATSDADAINAYMGSIAKKTQDNYKKVNDILRQLDPLSNDLDQAEKEINSLERVNSEQQHLLNRLNHRLGQATPKAQAQHQTQAAARAAQQAKDKQERDAIALKVGQDAAQQPAQVDPGIKQQLDKLSSRVTAIDTRTLPGDTANLARVAAAQGAGKMLPKVTHDAAAEIAQDNKPFDRNKLGAIKNALATQQNEDEVYESRLYAMRKAGYDIL